MKEYKYSVGIWAYGGCGDRFNMDGYQQSRTLQQKLELASQTRGLSGVELHYNGDFTESGADDVKRMLSDTHLAVSAMNCETFGDRDFRHGALTNPDRRIRRKALDIIKRGCDMARNFDSSVVNLWPGADGFDVPFQVDYNRMWDLMNASIEEIAVYAGDLKISMEYKYREPRLKSTLGTVGKTLMLARDINRDNVGVTIDFGHSLQCKENPAEALCLLSRFGKLFHVHMNDNSGDWDDDLFVGPYHLWETLEFLMYLKRVNYKGWVGLDMSPAREDQIGAVEHSINLLNKLCAYAERIDGKELEEASRHVDALTAQKIVLGDLFN